MGGGPSVVRAPGFQKSNAELTSSLHANFLTHKQAAASVLNGSIDGSAKDERKVVPYTSWTTLTDSTLYVPTISFAHSGLAEERAAYDITVKLFYLPSIPSSRRRAHTREAVDLVLKELHVPSIDLLIVSFPNMSFDDEDEDSDDDESLEEAEDGEREIGLGAQSGGGVEELDSMISTWRTLEELHDEGIIHHLGLSEFGTQRLERFLNRTRIRPSVDQINVRDCCVVPKPLILYAKKERIELLTHNDCTNILPRGTLRELLGQGDRGVGVLANNDGEGLKGDVEPQWVVKYTAVVKNRGVIENKGYFAVAELKREGAR